MNHKPPWLLDVETAKQECRLTFDKLVAQIEGLRQLVEDSDSFAPDALRVSFEESMPDLKRAAQAAIARLQILVHIRAGTIRWREEEPEKKID